MGLRNSRARIACKVQKKTDVWKLYMTVKSKKLLFKM